MSDTVSDQMWHAYLADASEYGEGVTALITLGPTPKPAVKIPNAEHVGTWDHEPTEAEKETAQFLQPHPAQEQQT